MNTSNKQAGFIGVIALVVAVLLLGGIVYYSSSHKSEEKLSVTNDEAVPSDQGAMMGIGVEFKDGKLVLDNEGKMTALTQEYVFENGTKVSLKGVVTKKDGTTVSLKDGQSVWPDGSITEAGEMMASTTSTAGSEKMMINVGSYEVYDASKIARAATGKVVLFFRAVWCPTCHALDADIHAHLNNIPKGVTILDVDYDHSNALKQRYGITSQHTLVQVDKDGNQIKKWSGSPTLANLVAEIK